MNISIYIISKKPSKNIMAAIAEYGKRLSASCKFSYNFIKNNKLTNLLNKDTYYIILSRDNKNQLPSLDFAKKIDSLARESIKDLTFILASDDVYPLLNERGISQVDVLSLSQLPISLDLLAVILTEQVYRAFKILEGHPYHK